MGVCIVTSPQFGFVWMDFQGIYTYISEELVLCTHVASHIIFMCIALVDFITVFKNELLLPFSLKEPEAQKSHVTRPRLCRWQRRPRAPFSCLQDQQSFLHVSLGMCPLPPPGRPSLLYLPLHCSPITCPACKEVPLTTWCGHVCRRVFTLRDWSQAETLGLTGWPPDSRPFGSLSLTSWFFSAALPSPSLSFVSRVIIPKNVRGERNSHEGFLYPLDSEDQWLCMAPPWLQVPEGQGSVAGWRDVGHRGETLASYHLQISLHPQPSREESQKHGVLGPSVPGWEFGPPFHTSFSLGAPNLHLAIPSAFSTERLLWRPGHAWLTCPRLLWVTDCPVLPCARPAQPGRSPGHHLSP